MSVSKLLLRACAAGEHKDAVGVCAREMGDPQLALFLARLLDGRASPAAGAAGSAAAPGPLLRGVIAGELLPGALPIAFWSVHVQGHCSRYQAPHQAGCPADSQKLLTDRISLRWQ